MGGEHNGYRKLVCDVRDHCLLHWGITVAFFVTITFARCCQYHLIFRDVHLAAADTMCGAFETQLGNQKVDNHSNA